MSTTNIEPHRKHISNRSFSPYLDWFYKGSRPFYVATFTSATVSTKSTQRNFDSLIAKISKHWTLVGVFDIWELGPIIFIDPSALDGWHGQYLIGHLHLSRAFPWYHLRLVRPGNSRFFYYELYLFKYASSIRQKKKNRYMNTRIKKNKFCLLRTYPC